jgi:hypothetical protein
MVAAMGYTLHLTRAEHWTESEALPLTAAEWHAYVAREPSLEPAAEHAAVWTPVPGGPPLLLRWHAGRVDCDGADEALAERLVPMARALGAQVQGDDGELYPRAVASARELQAEQRRRSRLALRTQLEQLRYRLTHLFRPPRHEAWLRPGARVRELDGARGTVVRVQPWAMHGSGLVTVRLDDGREETRAMFAHGLEADS